MPNLTTLSRRDLENRAGELDARYAEFRVRRLSLDMTRGKPCTEQLDLSLGLLECNDYRAADGTDCRNYGVLEGLPEARALFAEYLDVAPTEIIVAGNSSLALMHDAIVQALLRPVPGGERPWRSSAKVRFLCPSPGYDRHFAICEYLRIEMIPIAMTGEGPDMDEVERAVASDENVKGIWCVPRYQNPMGMTFSDAVVERFAAMKTRAPDFRIFWDNAYALHHLSDDPDPLADVFDACREQGHPDRVLIFGSTSKISFAGAGIGMIAASESNLRWFREGMSRQTIGHDKMNQLRHVRFYGDLRGLVAHMKKHAAILKPKFDAVEEVLERELGDLDVAAWTRPKGGYFVSLDTPDGCAREVVAMAADAGVRLTPAGATFPYGRDPRDRNVRIAPSVPSVEEIRQAMEIVAVSIQRVAISRRLGRAA